MNTDAPDLVEQWEWSVEGREQSHGTTVRSFEQDGVIPGVTCAGEALQWLLDHGPVWDGVDQRHALTLHISPAAGPARTDQEPGR